jgi:hypothetical protein
VLLDEDEVVPVVEPAALALVLEVVTGVLVATAAAAAVEPVVVAVAAASGAAAAGAAPLMAIGSGETAIQNPPKASAVRPASAQRPGVLFRLVVRRARPRCSVPAAGASEAAAGARVGVRAVWWSCVGLISFSIGEMSVPRADQLTPIGP